MKLIIGLGNPENQYNFTRHNFGFLALDFYAKTHNLNWNQTPKFNAIYATLTPVNSEKSAQDSAEKIMFIKPQTYYNDSGKAVRSFMNFYKIPTSNILILCDDFNLPFGELRYRSKGSAGGNNGLKSIISELGTDEFPRLRLGTGSDLRTQIGDTDFVLSKFTPAEKDQLPTLLTAISGKIDDFLH